MKCGRLYHPMVFAIVLCVCVSDGAVDGVLVSMLPHLDVPSHVTAPAAAADDPFAHAAAVPVKAHDPAPTPGSAASGTGTTTVDDAFSFFDTA